MNPEIPVGKLTAEHEVARVSPDFSVEWVRVTSVEPKRLTPDGKVVAYRVHLANGEDFVFTSRRRLEVRRKGLEVQVTLAGELKG